MTTTNAEILTTTIKVAIHRRGTNPIFGEGVVHVSVEDETGGPFIVLESDDDNSGGLRIDMEELEAAVVAARMMIGAAQLSASTAEEDQ